MGEVSEAEAGTATTHSLGEEQRLGLTAGDENEATQRSPRPLRVEKGKKWEK
jgi:hypothetical protein